MNIRFMSSVYIVALIIVNILACFDELSSPINRSSIELFLYFGIVIILIEEKKEEHFTLL